MVDYRYAEARGYYTREESNVEGLDNAIRNRDRLDVQLPASSADYSEEGSATGRATVE
jgi:hypothetical protein